MAKGRRQASIPIILAMISLLILAGEPAESTVFKVGADRGWTFGVQDWSQGQTFQAGDILEFIYEEGFHNVLKVHKTDYENCGNDDAIRTYTTGSDRIELESGDHYFICGVDDHCEQGMKIGVTVL